MRKLAVLLSAFCLTVGAANAQNLLLNGDFETPQATGWTGTSWTGWNWGGGWSNHEIKNNIPGQMNGGNGTYLLNCGAMNNGGGGANQTLSAAAGMQYTLTVDSGADKWWLPTGWMSMIWLDGSGTTISDTTRTTVDPAVYGPNFDIEHPMLNYSLTGVAPAGAVQVKVEFSANNIGGSVTFDNAILTVSEVPEPSAAALAALGSALLLGYRSRRNAARA